MSKNALISPKVASSTIGAAIVVIVVWCVHQFADVDIPGSVGSAITLVVTAVLGYFIRDNERDAGIAALAPTTPKAVPKGDSDPS